MEIELCYPDWKEKAVIFSYDDGQIYDRRLVEMLNHYKLKGTFHLNSAMIGKEGFISSKEAKILYKGHEIACHGKYHHYPTHLSGDRLLEEFYEDRFFLEKITGDLVKGCSYAFGEYNEKVINVLETLGIVYSRTVEDTGDFRIPEDFMRWNPTCHHNKAFEGEIVERFLNKPEYQKLPLLYVWGHSFEFEREDTWEKMEICHHNKAFEGEIVERFLNKPEYQKLPLLYVWGHSFEFEREDTWEKMEILCEKLSGDKNVWYTTSIDYVEYMKAAKSLEISLDGTKIENSCKIPVCVKLNGKPQIV